MKIAIVITGYYFKYIELYQSIISESKLYDDIEFDFYISSHIEESNIPLATREFLCQNHWKTIFFPNLGWDWGCFSQFMEWFENSNDHQVDYFLFLHDDIKIQNAGFIKEFLKKIKNGFRLVGNSLPYSKIEDYKTDFPEEIYILEKNGFPISSYGIKLVRGSAFFIDYELAKRSFTKLPIQKYGKIDLANRSLRMFAAIIANEIGVEKVGYLSDTHFKSKFIVEEMRGHSQGIKFFLKKGLFKLIRKTREIINNLLIAVNLLKNSLPKEKKGLIKLQITDTDIIAGYLNYVLFNTERSDIEDLNNELIQLLGQNQIGEIKISNDLAFKEKMLFESILSIISKHANRSVEIFLEGKIDKENKEYIKNIINVFSNIRLYDDYLFHLRTFKVNHRILIAVN